MTAAATTEVAPAPSYPTSDLYLYGARSYLSAAAAAAGPNHIRDKRIADAAEIIARMPGATCETPRIPDDLYGLHGAKCWFCEDGLSNLAEATLRLELSQDCPDDAALPLACSICLKAIARLAKDLARTKIRAVVSAPSKTKQEGRAA